MSHRRPLLLRARACSVMLLCLLFCTACPKESPVAAVPTVEDSVRRQKEAQALFMEAEARIVPEKIALYRRLLAFYPEAAEAPIARLKLVFYLRDPVVAKHAEALSAAREFAVLFPGDLRASECFRWLDSDAGEANDKERRSAVQTAWKTHLDKAVADAANLNALEKLSLWMERADLARRMRLPADAIKLYEEGLAIGAARQDLHLRCLFEMVRIQSDDPAQHAAARANIEKALVLSRAGVKGPTVADLEAQLALLK